jgi:hypothetical protein
MAKSLLCLLQPIQDIQIESARSLPADPCPGEWAVFTPAFRDSALRRLQLDLAWRKPAFRAKLNAIPDSALKAGYVCACGMTLRVLGATSFSI